MTSNVPPDTSRPDAPPPDVAQVVPIDAIRAKTFVSITRLRLRSIRFLPAFALLTRPTMAQAKRADGFLGGGLMPDRRWTFWTMTLWRDQAAMRAYIANGAHLSAMPKLLHWCDEASIVHWEQDDAIAPTWKVATDRMRAEGRASKVRHPSPNHADLSFAAPRIHRAVDILPQG